MFRSISNKLTFIMVLLVTALLLGSMLFMSYSFETYYTRTKKTALSENLESFRNRALSPGETLIQSINDFEASNNTRLFIFGQNGTLQYMAYGGNRIDGDYIEIINRFFGDLVTDKTLVDALLVNRSIISREYERADGSIRYFLTASSINVLDADSFAISISSMVPINESARTIKNFFVYVFAGGFIVVVILAFLISHTVTRPIRKLTSSSKELARLNFDTQIDRTQKDEIGELAESLSTLAANLKTALSELNEKNRLLEEDVLKGQKLENQRKDFIRDISHELKTPITLIQGYTEGLIDGISEESRDEYLSVILDESKNMEKLVKDMIELSYTESDAFNLNKTEFNLSTVLVNSAAPFLDYPSEKLSFNFSIGSQYYIEADLEKLSTAIRNIIKNAMTYTDLHQEGQVNISLYEEHQELILKIFNTPAHIDETELENIWVQFYKKDRSRQRKDGSSGLGLSIIRNILEKHELDYDLRNEGNGVAFVIRFKEYKRKDQ
ncbi:HAMP domain-containing protein [Proteiniclasticum sp. SCR006]|uniref:histidine kinase n=1 Tax=Proteiniclasticum aestuarii TaxID=2817862 RepID=A0A939HF82_9CLOT|nr:histidine kinase dimerization/phospho-acceptor domain-containing protein [Proteiniclasticum aestuarii]MBO1266228.1 HAMP domain-containing protein [Proteiniclasticum aestuarii]